MLVVTINKVVIMNVDNFIHASFLNYINKSSVIQLKMDFCLPFSNAERKKISSYKMIS